ncbi:MAG TPA: sulfatase-like hydrolase/transferase [Thermoanaerobaculia bacterium]|jgi:arylsulfatase A-like enzyme/tetratricopeptide (TPR) repeat protein|nr:sulfatase-like hydrolase/transferase [Thermoanaerobaculia bacterium]
MSPTRSRRFALVFIAGILAASLLASSCGKRSIGSPSSTTPVILISIDTLRSDHLPAYGYKGVATPAIDALRADSILYERAYSHIPMTLPSHVTIFTGMLPADSGIRDNMGNRLPESIPTLPDLLKKNGYATGAAVSAFVLRRETGMAHGFDFFDDSTKSVNGGEVLGRIQRVGGETLQAARPWLDKQGERPFFFFLHLYDPHTPYEPPEPYFSRYSNHYDGEIAYSDSVVGDLIADLKRRGLYDKSLIILLSDHGEGLNEHGEEEHGMFLYRETLQVPLIVKLPQSRRAGTSVPTPVQLVDVFPTILERTATPPPAAGPRPGQSLLTFLDGGPTRPVYSETYYPKFHFGWSDMESLIDGKDHFIRAPIPELFDLAADPGEKKNLVQENRRVYVRMQNAIQPLIKDAVAPSGFDPEEAAKLAALGYVGSTVANQSGKALPDPKTELGAFMDIRVAYTYYKNKNYPEALRLTNKLLATNAQIVDLWDLKSKIEWAMGQHDAALESSKEGLRQNPGAIALLFDVANLSLTHGDLDAAQQHAELGVKIEPGQAHEILSRVFVARNNPDRAEQEAKLAMQTLVDPTPDLMILAGLEMDREHYQKALAYLDQAAVRVREKSPPRLLNLHLTRGDALARLGRNEEAEGEFHAEINDFPADARAYSSLIMLLATERRFDEATKVVFDAIKASPEPHTYTVIAETLKAIGDDKGALYWAYQGMQRYPQDAELRGLPRHLAAVTPALKSRLQ